MLKNHLKIAWRNLINLKSFGLINLLGLVAGTACSLAILLFVLSQFGYEQHFDDHDRVFKVTTFIDHPEDQPDANLVSAGPPIGPGLVNDFEEVVTQSRVVNMGGEFLMEPTDSENTFFETGHYLVDSTFFDVFSYNLLEGDVRTALDRPGSLVLSASLAAKIFGEGNSALGKEIQMSSEGENFLGEVTGVFDDSERKTHLQPNYLISMSSTGMGNFVLTYQGWAGNNFAHTYIKLSEGTNPKSLEASLPDFLKRNAEEQLRQAEMDKTLGLIPITDINLKTAEYSFPLGKVSDISYIYMLIAIGFFIQLMACINYINLTTAQATRRAKEIGVRKVNGATGDALMAQFGVESLLTSVLAVFIAMPIVAILLPFINQLFDSNLVSSDLWSPPMLGAILTLGIVTGLISGAYPAFFLSMIDPSRIFKSELKERSKGFTLRNSLVVFQFAMVFILVYGVAVVSQQLSHLNNVDVGFSKAQKLVIPMKTDAVSASYETLKNEFEQLSQVDEVSATQFYPSQNIWYDNKIYKRGTNVAEGIVVQVNYAKDNFFETMDIEMLQGRAMVETDTNRMVVNEKFLEVFNIPQDEAIGFIFDQWSSDGSPRDSWEVIGVISDYNYLSLKSEILPVATFHGDELANLILSFNGENEEQVIAAVSGIWEEVHPGVPFQYSFLDEDLRETYAEEQRLQKVAYTFTGLAILISLLGIWGLISFSLDRRTKEIGLRKVLGASVPELAGLLSKDFVLLVILSILLATPIAIYAMSSWLDEFAYKIDGTYLLLIGSAALTMVVCLITVIYKTSLAAMGNPIQSIKKD